MNTLELPEDKVQNLLTVLASFAARKRASLKQLQQLAGKLSWACVVVKGDRIYLQRVLDTLRPLKAASQKACLSSEFKADVHW